jgi:hypothetical protein
LSVKKPVTVVDAPVSEKDKKHNEFLKKIKAEAVAKAKSYK